MPTRLSAAMHFANYISQHEPEKFGIEQINGLKINDYEYNVVNNGIGETFIQATKEDGVYPFCKLNPFKNFHDNILLCLRIIKKRITENTENKKLRKENDSELTHKFLQKDDDRPILELTDMSHVERKNYDGGKTSRKTKTKSRKSKSRKTRKTKKSKKSKSRKTK